MMRLHQPFRNSGAEKALQSGLELEPRLTYVAFKLRYGPVISCTLLGRQCELEQDGYL
jgi:hypothetical protein